MILPQISTLLGGERGKAPFDMPTSTKEAITTAAATEEQFLLSVERIYGRIFVEIFLFSLFCRFRNRPGATHDRPSLQKVADLREGARGVPKSQLLLVKSA